MAIGFVIIAVYLLHSLFKGRPAPANPWGAATLEWQTPSPPPHDNFAVQPQPGDPYDVSELVLRPGDRRIHAPPAGGELRARRGART